jgi:transcriptional regulator with XRE-family HTH domain
MNTEKWFEDKLETFERELYAEELILDLTEQIVAAMKELGVNRTELAARMGVSKAFVTKLLRGNTNITLKTMASLARSLGCNVNIKVCPKDVELSG